MIGLDTFELYFPKMKVKARYLLMTCLIMRFTSGKAMMPPMAQSLGRN